MSKQSKINQLLKHLNPVTPPVMACSVKHYNKGEEPQPEDLFNVGNEKLTLKEFEALQGRNIVVTILNDENHV